MSPHLCICVEHNDPPCRMKATCGLGESLAQKISEFHRNFCFRDLISLTIDKQLCLTQNSVKKKGTWMDVVGLFNIFLDKQTFDSL